MAAELIGNVLNGKTPADFRCVKGLSCNRIHERALSEEVMDAGSGAGKGPDHFPCPSPAAGNDIVV